MEVDWSATKAMAEINKVLADGTVQEAIESLDALVDELRSVREALVSDLENVEKTEK